MNLTETCYDYRYDIYEDGESQDNDYRDEKADREREDEV